MSETREVITIPGSWDTVENWRNWMRALLSDAGFTNIRTYEDGTIKANYWKIPFGDVTIDLTEHLAWDGQSRTPDNEFETERYVSVEIISSVMWANPGLLIDKIVNEIETVNLNSLQSRPKIVRNNSDNTGGGSFGAKFKYIGIPVLILIGVLALIGVPAYNNHKEASAREQSYVLAVQNAGDSLGLELSKDTILSYGRDFCKGMDNKLTVDEALWILPIGDETETDRVTKIIVAYFAGTELCPDYAAEVRGWKSAQY